MNREIIKKLISEKLEDELYKYCISHNNVDYNLIAFEVVGISKIISEEQIISDLQKGNVGWKSSVYRGVVEDEEENLVVEEGAFVCRNKGCLSKRCYISQAQTRSGDEGATTYVTCSVCHEMYKVT